MLPGGTPGSARPPPWAGASRPPAGRALPYVAGRIKMDIHLIIYCALTLLAMYSIAERFAPVDDLTAAGCRVGYVYDGDTIELICGSQKDTARLVGFDTPETKEPGCDAELALGKQATARLRVLVKAGDVVMIREGHDKYGRVLVTMRTGGRDVADMMVAEGLATYYRGGSRVDWCERLGQ